MKFLVICLLSLFMVSAFATTARHIRVYQINDGPHQIKPQPPYYTGFEVIDPSNIFTNKLFNIECFAYDEKQQPLIVQWNVGLDSADRYEIRDSHMFTKDLFKIDNEDWILQIGTRMIHGHIKPFGTVLCFTR